MMKKILIGLASIAVLGGAYYLISPLWNVIEVSEESPLTAEKNQIQVETKTILETNLAETEIQTEEELAPIEVKEAMPDTAKILAENNFVAQAHDVAGKAILIEKGNEKIIRFEDFDTVNGPNLHIYLSADLAGKDFVDLGKIKATKGNVNYVLPADVDTKKYNKVLVWCVPFQVLFSSAEL